MFQGTSEDRGEKPVMQGHAELIYLAFIYLQMATYTGHSIPNMGN